MLLRQFDSVGVFLVALVVFCKDLSSHVACFSATHLSTEVGLWPRMNSSPQPSHLRVPISCNPEVFSRLRDRHQDNKQQNRDDKNQKRYYDKSHKDYHNWDDREAGAYQQGTTENHRDNRDFSHLKPKEQSEYWNWRHARPDDDKGRH